MANRPPVSICKSTRTWTLRRTFNAEVCTVYIRVCVYHHLKVSTLPLKYFWSALRAFFAAFLPYSYHGTAEVPFKTLRCHCGQEGGGPLCVCGVLFKSTWLNALTTRGPNKNWRREPRMSLLPVSHFITERLVPSQWKYALVHHPRSTPVSPSPLSSLSLAMCAVFRSAL